MNSLTNHSPKNSLKSFDASNSENGFETKGKEVYSTWPKMMKNWPWCTMFIVGNEFCERFSYFGMRTVLTLYLLNVLKFSEKASTGFFNGFTVICYLLPMFGSILADGFIGPFWTIITLSTAYAIGQILLAVSSIQTFQASIHPGLDLLGLVIIAIGTGGIKPCVAPFGADQFEQHQEKMIILYFSIFYFSINAGSMISTFFSPIFRAQSCLGQDSCFPLAFGIPAILMVIATVLFGIGSIWYKRPKVKQNIFKEVGVAMTTAIKNKFVLDKKREHWLDHYLDLHDCECDEKCLELREAEKDDKICQKEILVMDIKSLLRVIVMYLPVPFFWALYDQQGSVWTIQALQMDSRLWGDFSLLPDQMQTANPVLVLLFIPFFQGLVYPLVEKVIALTPLRKLVVGGLLAVLAFVISGIVQLSINETLPTIPGKHQSFVSVVNTFDGCNITVSATGIEPTVIMSNYSLHDDASIGKSEVLKLASGSQNFKFGYTGDCQPDLPAQATYTLVEKLTYDLVVTKFGTFLGEVKTDKPTNGNGEFGLIIQLALSKSYTQNLALCRLRDDGKWSDETHPCDPQSDRDFYYWQKDYNFHTNDIDGFRNYSGTSDGSKPIITFYTYKPVRPGKFELFYMYDSTPKDVTRKTPTRYELNVNSTGIKTEINGQGGVFVFVITGDDMQNAEKHVFQAVPSNKVKIYWQFPQYIVITCAEIFFSITGYEFAYSQAAPSMKSLVQALWLFTTSIGDTIIVLIAIWDPFSDMAVEFFAYAGVMLVVIIIFALMSIFYYEYNYYTGEVTSSGTEDTSLKMET